MKGNSMATGFWGKKIGMTQTFAEDRAIPVTVINASDWFITQVKTNEKDGYEAVQLGCLKNKFASSYDKEKFLSEWIKKPQQYFSVLKEVKISGEGLEIGSPFNWGSLIQAGEYVDVFGKTSGKGFAGVMKRYNFGGGRKTHGGKMGRGTGSIGTYRSQGRVIKGKKLPGHMGDKQRAIKSLEVIKVDPEANVLLVKGSVPGKSGSLLFIRKQG
jgi:large subunit ribosomal protein L3